MMRIISSSMVALLSLPRLLLRIPRREDGNPHTLISDGQSKPAARSMARGAPPDALGRGGGWQATTQMPCQAVTHEIQNAGGRHPCSTSQI